MKGLAPMPGDMSVIDQLDRLKVMRPEILGLPSLSEVLLKI